MIGVGPQPKDDVPIRKQRTQRYKEEGHMTMEGEIEVMQRRAMECQRLSGATRS